MGLRIEGDFFLTSEPRVSMYVDRETMRLLLVEQLLRLFPRAQVPGLLLAACWMIGHNPVVEA